MPLTRTPRGCSPGDRPLLGFLAGPVSAPWGRTNSSTPALGCCSSSGAGVGLSYPISRLGGAGDQLDRDSRRAAGGTALRGAVVVAPMALTEGP